MTLFLQRLFDALDNGAIYAAMALALALIYKSTGHLNFAQGEMAMFSAFIAYVLSSEQDLPTWLAIVVSMVLSFVAGAAIERVLIRPLERRNPLSVVIVTLGLFLVVGGAGQRVWLGTPKEFDNPFPDSAEAITIGDAALRHRTIWFWGLLLVLVALLFLMLNRTKIGLAFRAVASNRESSQLVGIPLGRTLMVGWGLAASLGALAGSLRAASTPTFDTNLMLPVLVYSFAAVTLGGFDSLGGAVLGGLGIAVFETMVSGYVEQIGGELAQATALVMIIVVLLLRPSGLFGSHKIERV
jgi:branched-chain amino acid transport system permease protein